MPYNMLISYFTESPVRGLCKSVAIYFFILPET